MNYIVFDTEFSTEKHYGRIGNPWYNQLVAIGLKTKDELFSKYVYPGKLTNFIIQEDILVAHNSKVDLLLIWHLPEVQEFFKRGGKVWDTAAAHFLLSGQREKYPALREIAVSSYGCKEREKVMEAYWDQGIDTKDIPKELVLKDVENDVCDTEVIYLQQIDKAKQMDMISLIEYHCDMTLALCEIEYNGMYINKTILQTNKQALENELINQQQLLTQYVEKYWK